MCSPNALKNCEIASLSYNFSQIMVQNYGMGLKIVYNGVEIIDITYLIFHEYV